MCNYNLSDFKIIIVFKINNLQRWTKKLHPNVLGNQRLVPPNKLYNLDPYSLLFHFWMFSQNRCSMNVMNSPLPLTSAFSTKSCSMPKGLFWTIAALCGICWIKRNRTKIRQMTSLSLSSLQTAIWNSQKNSVLTLIFQDSRIQMHFLWLRSTNPTLDAPE